MSIRVAGWKFIVGEEEGTRELFDLIRDPKERVNLHDAQPERVKQLSELLTTWLNRATHHAEATGVLSDEDVMRLEALGYKR